MADDLAQYEIEDKELEKYAQPSAQPSGDKLTEQTQATAKAVGAPTEASQPLAGNMSKKGLFGEDVSPAEEEQITRRAHTLQSMPSNYQAPLSNATGVLGLAETPGAIARGGRGALNWAASKMREPATAAQSLEGVAGTPKNILPRSMQRWTIPDWVPETIAPKGELGTPTNPGPFRTFLGRNAAKVKPQGMEYPFPGSQSTAPGEVSGLPPVSTPATGGPSGAAIAANAKYMTPSGYPAPEVSTTTGRPVRINIGRTGSAGDPATWSEEDLWAGYMKNRSTPLGETLADEIKRRGQAASAAENIRPISKVR